MHGLFYLQFIPKVPCLLQFPHLDTGVVMSLFFRRKLRIWSHLLKKSLMENFIFCAVFHSCTSLSWCCWFFFLVNYPWYLNSSTYFNSTPNFALITTLIFLYILSNSYSVIMFFFPIFSYKSSFLSFVAFSTSRSATLVGVMIIVNQEKIEVNFVFFICGYVAGHSTFYYKISQT